MPLYECLYVSCKLIDRVENWYIPRAWTFKLPVCGNLQCIKSPQTVLLLDMAFERRI